VSFVSSSGNGATSSSVVVTAPSGIQDDDILVCFVAAFKYFGNPPITLPSGFTEWYERECKEYNTAIGWKRADSESGNYTVSATGATSMCAGICVYRGRVATGDPCDVKSDTPYTTADTNVRAAGVTITDEGADLIYAGWVYNGESDPGLDVPSGMSSRIALAHDYTGIAMGDLLNQSTGATGNKDGTHDSPNSDDYKHAFLVALSPATGTPSAFCPRVVLL
jgi:hypothetical protein